MTLCYAIGMLCARSLCLAGDGDAMLLASCYRYGLLNHNGIMSTSLRHQMRSSVRSSSTTIAFAMPRPRGPALHIVQPDTAAMASAAGPQALELIATQRRLLLRRAPRHTLNIAGVTFEGRQAAVQRLAPGEPLLFSKEPSNPYDPRAVAISTLEGQKLGYVAAHLTAGFPLQTSFGRVVSAGPVLATVGDEDDEDGIWGARVSCAPAVHGLCLDPLPSSWQQDLQQVFGAQQWQQLQQQALQQYHQRCAVSAVPAASVPLQVVPSWCWDYEAKQVRLTGLMPLCEPLVLCREQLLQQGQAAAADRAAAVKLFTEVMGWQDEFFAGQYVEQYVDFVKQRQQQAELEEWQLVLPADLAGGGASPPAPQTGD